MPQRASVLSASKPGSPWQNRCIKSIKEELASLSECNDIAELYVGVAHATQYYNNERIHLSLKISPAAYAAQLKG